MFNIPKTTTIYAGTAGLCASAGSVFGKLSGSPNHVLIQGIFFVLMIAFNAAVWTLFVKALQCSKSSLTATVISAAASYFCSALIGFAIFGEITTVLWWCGTFLVLMGLVLITRSQQQIEEYEKNSD